VDNSDRVLRNAIDTSYGSLAPGEQALFRRLGVFVAGCTLEAAEAVAGAAAELGGDAVTETDVLLRKRLLQVEKESVSGDRRFGMLEPIRRYALDTLSSSGEEAASRRTHAEYYLKLAEAAEPRLFEADQTTWLDRLQAEQGNFRAAITWAIEQGNSELALELAGSLALYWLDRGYGKEGLSWLDRGLVMSSEPTAGRAKGLFAKSWLLWGENNHEQARASLEQARSLYQRLGDREGVAWSLHFLGNIFYYLCDYSRAAQLIADGLKLFKEMKVERGVRWSLLNLALVERAKAEYEEAEKQFRQALELFSASGDYRGLAWANHELGVLVYLCGRIGEAAAFLTVAQAIFEKLGNIRGVAWSRHQLGIIAYCHGQVVRSEGLLQQGRSLFEALSDFRGVAWADHELSTVARYQNEFDESDERASDALSWFQTSQEQQGKAWSCHDLGEVARHRASEALLVGNGSAVATLHDQAEARFRQGQFLFEKVDDRFGHAWIVRSFGDLARDRGEHHAAETHYREALKEFTTLGDRRGMAWTWYRLGVLAMDRGDLQSAEQFLEEALTRFQEPRLGDQRGQAWSYQALGTVALDRDDFQKATQLFAAAEQLRQHNLTPLTSVEEAARNRGMDAVRSNLNSAQLSAEQETGEALIRGQISVALGRLDSEELNIMRLFITRRTISSVAEALSISPSTVGRRITRIQHKLGAATRAQAVDIVLQLGLIEDSS
jgi:tetratricopeptide (TPR) repeat protein